MIKTINNTFIRLPENNDYYFGTTWTEWSWRTPTVHCHENHYWYDHQTNKWIVNGSPNIENISDIEYDQRNCIGCSKVDDLRDIEYALMNISDDETEFDSNLSTTIDEIMTTEMKMTTSAYLDNEESEEKSFFESYFALLIVGVILLILFIIIAVIVYIILTQKEDTISPHTKNQLSSRHTPTTTTTDGNGTDMRQTNDNK